MQVWIIFYGSKVVSGSDKNTKFASMKSHDVHDYMMTSPEVYLTTLFTTCL